MADGRGLAVPGSREGHAYCSIVNLVAGSTHSRGRRDRPAPATAWRGVRHSVSLGVKTNRRSASFAYVSLVQTLRARVIRLSQKLPLRTLRSTAHVSTARYTSGLVERFGQRPDRCAGVAGASKRLSDRSYHLASVPTTTY